jgi:hypothetical protein
VSEPAAGGALPVCNSVPLLERLPERLFLEGFRHWMAGYSSGDLSNWEEAWNIHAAALGTSGARVVVDRLARFVKAVRCWSICPIDCFPNGCRHVCRHECFALAMVAASQNHDLDCLSTAMRHLIQPDRHETAIRPALAYAEVMRENRLVLMAVPRAVIEEIAGRPVHERLH